MHIKRSILQVRLSLHKKCWSCTKSFSLQWYDIICICNQRTNSVFNLFPHQQAWEGLSVAPKGCHNYRRPGISAPVEKGKLKSGFISQPTPFQQTSKKYDGAPRSNLTATFNEVQAVPKFTAQPGQRPQADSPFSAPGTRTGPTYTTNVNSTLR